MNPHFKPHERELIKIAGFFKKHSKQLVHDGKLGSEHLQVGEAVDKFIEKMEEHADARAHVLQQREQLQKLVKDQAECPRCHTSDKIKCIGIEKNEKGWKSNRYKCRKCNIAFTWNKPNNPWDMISYIEELLTVMRLQYNNESASPQERELLLATINNTEEKLNTLKPVITTHDAEYEALQVHEATMEKLIHEFKNSLMIERIKMDTWENRQAK